MMFPDEQNEQHVGPRFRSFGQERQGDADQAVEAEFFQHAGVEHGRGRGRGGISRRRPGVERKERDEDAKADEQEDIGPALRGGGNEAVRREALKLDEIERARGFGHARGKDPPGR